MTGPHEADRLTRVRTLRSSSETMVTLECLDDDALAALVEGTVDPHLRSAGLSHLASCGRCRRAVASVARAWANPHVAREVAAIERAVLPRLHRFHWLALGTAAAALLLLVWPQRIEEPLPHRAPPITASPAPEAVSPVGTVAEARSLRWTPVSGADRYRVTLFTADGAVRYETEVTGTVAALPDSVQPGPGETGWWRVDARLGFDRWAESGLIEFSIDPGSAQ